MMYLLLDAASDAADIVQSSTQTQADVSQAFDKIWQSVLIGNFEGTGSLYGAIADVGVIVVVFAILFWTVQWAKTMLDVTRLLFGCSVWG